MVNERKDIRTLSKKYDNLQTLMCYVNKETLMEQHKKHMKGKASGLHIHFEAECLARDPNICRKKKYKKITIDNNLIVIKKECVIKRIFNKVLSIFKK